eukprot:GHRR01022907.1.p1 GENE.GHRR01022907.1~~GHRR01022907.1.p1  ORF type:complete len:260 (+),score=90.11 GHRR01022907.1:391-1170(+)
MLAASGPKLITFSPSELSTTIWALAKLKYAPSHAWLVQLLNSSYQQMLHFAPSDLTNVVWGLAQLQLQPSPLWISSYWAVTSKVVGRFSAIELKVVLYSVAKLRLQPPEVWLQALAAALDANMGQYESPEVLKVLRAVQHLQCKQAASAGSSSSSPGNNSIGNGWIFSSAACSSGSGQNSILPFTRDQQVQVRVLQPLDAVAAEAYSLACLVALMPEWLQKKVAGWPKQLAAQRSHQQQQLTGGVSSDMLVRDVHVATL